MHRLWQTIGNIDEHEVAVHVKKRFFEKEISKTYYAVTCAKI